MANEAIIRETFGSEGGDVINYAKGTTVALSYGTLVVITDARTVSFSSAATAKGAGVVAADANLADTRVSVITNAIAESTASGAILAGHPVAPTADNYIRSANNLSYAAGYALDGVADGGTVQWRVKT